ncbi:hypothetical protein Q8F55_006230 [Vanrija albida]|uniref:Uncharacterized protein n=1 Tax=Vanrija albida TaxID=181172 RepID=A0ABR3PWJ2_9TREE
MLATAKTPLLLNPVRTAVRTRTLASLAAEQRATPAAPPPAPAAERTTAQWVDFGRQHVTPGLGRVRDMVVVRGSGLEIETSAGERILDFSSGIGVLSLGHCHPAVSAAVHAQVDTLTHLQCSIGFHKPYLQLIERLQPIMPDPSLDSFFFWNSGSEAIEAAIKIARKATGRPNVISMAGGYHGRTYGSGALSRSKNIYTVGAGALMPGAHATPFPYWHGMSLPITTSEEELVRIATAQLNLLFRTQSAPKDTAAIFIEPVIGEGGYVPAPDAYLRHLRAVCDEHGILLVADEVQSGFGRTGAMWAIEHAGVRPDLLVFAKGVANGYPLSGVVAPRSVMETLDAGVLGGTYAGNAVACAAASAVVDYFGTHDVLGNVRARGEQLNAGLDRIAATDAGKKLIAERRGQNLMAAIEFRSADKLTHHGLPTGAAVPANIARRVQDKCLDAGLLLLTTSTFEVIRFIPSLTVSKAQVDTALGVFAQAVDEVAREG